MNNSNQSTFITSLKQIKKKITFFFFQFFFFYNGSLIGMKFLTDLPG